MNREQRRATKRRITAAGQAAPATPRGTECVGGPEEGQRFDVVMPRGYRKMTRKDHHLTLTFLVHESISNDAAPRAMLRRVADLHNEILRREGHPLFGTMDAASVYQRQAMVLLQRAAFAGVRLELRTVYDQPLAMGNWRQQVFAYPVVL